MKADPTEKLALGRTGLAISRICFGMAPLGNMPDTYGYSVEPERARETVRAAFDSRSIFWIRHGTMALGAGLTIYPWRPGSLPGLFA